MSRATEAVYAPKTGTRPARFQAWWLVNMPIIGSIALVAVGVVELLAVLLGAPSQVLFPLALVVFPLGLLLGVLENIGFPRLVQRLPFYGAFLLQGGAHLLLTLGLYAATQWLAAHLGLPALWGRPGPPSHAGPGPWRQVIIIYALVGFVTSLLRQLLLRMSRRRLWLILQGYYHQPITENRIFLFADLRDSTRLAETLGNENYSRLIRDFFHDLEPAITATRGEVYQYVGDEAVVTWPLGLGLAKANCLHCFFEMQRRIEQRAAYYEQHYGEVPTFKAGIHGGAVTTVLVGTVHSELVYHGDVLNTSARIQAQCNALRSKLLISADLLQVLGPQPDFCFTPKGSLLLRGKAAETPLLDVQLA